MNADGGGESCKRGGGVRIVVAAVRTSRRSPQFWMRAHEDLGEGARPLHSSSVVGMPAFLALTGDLDGEVGAVVVASAIVLGDEGDELLAAVVVEGRLGGRVLEGAGGGLEAIDEWP